MSKCWLCITTNENWNAIKAKEIWAVKESDQKKLDRLTIRDLLVFYVKQRSDNDNIVGPQIKAVFQVDSTPFHDSTKLLPDSIPRERFTYRVRIKPVIVAREGVDFKEIVPKIGFIKNKEKWFLYLQTAMRSIPKRDFDLLLSALESKA